MTDYSGYEGYDIPTDEVTHEGTGPTIHIPDFGARSVKVWTSGTDPCRVSNQTNDLRHRDRPLVGDLWVSNGVAKILVLSGSQTLWKQIST